MDFWEAQQWFVLASLMQRGMQKDRTGTGSTFGKGPIRVGCRLSRPGKTVDGLLCYVEFEWNLSVVRMMGVKTSKLAAIWFVDFHCVLRMRTFLCLIFQGSIRVCVCLVWVAKIIFGMRERHARHPLPGRAYWNLCAGRWRIRCHFAERRGANEKFMFWETGGLLTCKTRAWSQCGRHGATLTFMLTASAVHAFPSVVSSKKYFGRKQARSD